MTKLKGKMLFSIKTKLTLKEFQRMVRYFPKFYFSWLMYTIFIQFIVLFIIEFIYGSSLIESIVIDCVVFLLIAIIYRIKLDWLARREYLYYLKKGLINEYSVTDFYDYYLIRTFGQSEKMVEYSKISLIIETDSNFYLKGFFGIFNIQKSKCSPEQISFIRNINPSSLVDKMSSEKSKVMLEMIDLHRKFIEKLLFILFILVIFSIWGAVGIFNFVTKDEISALYVNNMWIYFLFLPLPVLSIVLGFRYRKFGLNTTKNIVGGFIVGFLFLAFGSFSFVIPTGEIDYKNIQSYRDILSVSPPSNGVLIQERYKKYFDSDKINVVVTKAFYREKDNVTEFLNEIQKSGYWIYADKINQEFRRMLPLPMKTQCDNCYYLVYNADSKEYNKFPENFGKYHIYAVLYNLEEKLLEINDFDYIYSND